MNHDHLKNSTMDEADRQIQQALLSAPVPTSAKQRLLEMLQSEQTLQRATEVAVQLDQVQLDATQQDFVEQASVPVVVAQTESRPAVITAKAGLVPRSRKQTMAIMACLAASVLAILSVYFAAQPYSQERLVAESTRTLDIQPESSWENATLTSWTESLSLLRIAGVVRSPKHILQQPSTQIVIGSNVRIWKLEFENQPALYAVELLDAPSIQGVQEHLQRLDQGNQSWSMAAIRVDKSVFVFLTKGNLDRIIQVSPLA